jgi:hypothetical protein
MYTTMDKRSRKYTGSWNLTGYWIGIWMTEHGSLDHWSIVNRSNIATIELNVKSIHMIITLFREFYGIKVKNISD